MAVGDGGLVLTSSDGISWNETALAVVPDLVALAGGTGAIFAFADDGGVWKFDGTWNLLDPRNEGNFYAVAVSGSGLFVAAGSGGRVLVSGNGTDWSSAATPTTEDLNGLAHGAGKFVAVGNNGTIVTSPDGVNWLSAGSGTSANLPALAHGTAGFVAVGQGGAWARGQATALRGQSRQSLDRRMISMRRPSGKARTSRSSVGGASRRRRMVPHGRWSPAIPRKKNAGWILPASHFSTASSWRRRARPPPFHRPTGSHGHAAKRPSCPARIFTGRSPSATASPFSGTAGACNPRWMVSRGLPGCGPLPIRCALPLIFPAGRYLSATGERSLPPNGGAARTRLRYPSSTGKAGRFPSGSMAPGRLFINGFAGLLAVNRARSPARVGPQRDRRHAGRVGRTCRSDKRHPDAPEAIG